MPLPPYPPQLENKTWQKKKSALAGETGIGEKLNDLAAAYKKINLAAFTALENARSLGELQQWTPQGDAEVVKVQAAAKAFRDFSLFAPRKAAELAKKKAFPKETLKLIEQMARIAESFDTGITQAAQDIRKQAADRLAVHGRQRIDVQAALQHQAPRQWEAPELDETLINQLERLRTVGREVPFHFVVALGRPSGLVINRTGIITSHRNEAKSLRDGGGRIIEGMCHCEGQVYIFTIEEEPPEGIARKIARAIGRQARRRVKVKVRGVGIERDDETDVDDETDAVDTNAVDTDAVDTDAVDADAVDADAVETEAVQTEAVVNETGDEALPPTASKANLIQRIRRMTDEAKQLAQAHPTLDAALKKRLTDAVRHVQGDNVTECERLLADVETVLGRLRQASERRGEQGPPQAHPL